MSTFIQNASICGSAERRYPWVIWGWRGYNAINKVIYARTRRRQPDWVRVFPGAREEKKLRSFVVEGHPARIRWTFSRSITHTLRKSFGGDFFSYYIFYSECIFWLGSMYSCDMKAGEWKLHFSYFGLLESLPMSPRMHLTK